MANRKNSTRSLKRHSGRERATGPIMALPAVLGLLVFIAIPFVMAVVLSFTNLRMGSPLPTELVGLQQYRRVLTDDSFQRALLNNCVFAIIVVPLQTAIALGLALLLNQELKGRAILRTLFFMPVVFPMALVAVIWKLIYAPGPNGMLNSFLQFVSFGMIEPLDVLHDGWLALPGIMLLSMWQGVGFQMVVLLAGLQAIPQTLYEAAAIDRAGKWSQFIHVTLPQLRNPIIFTALVTTILAFRVYAQVEIMTQGGPVNATTTVMYASELPRPQTKATLGRTTSAGGNGASSCPGSCRFSDGRAAFQSRRQALRRDSCRDCGSAA